MVAVLFSLYLTMVNLSFFKGMKLAIILLTNSRNVLKFSNVLAYFLALTMSVCTLVEYGYIMFAALMQKQVPGHNF